ncbi:MAG: hypothetical protein ABI333_09470 [bacterium]
MCAQCGKPRSDFIRRCFFPLAIGTVVAIEWLFGAAPARANCGLEPHYQAQVVGSTVYVMPNTGSYAWERVCPDSGGMLRMNVESGEVVRLADYCLSSADVGSSWDYDGGDTDVYVDECVSPGSYEYGFAVPYSCPNGACGTTPYYTTAAVTVGDASCQRSPDNPGPNVYVGSVPWTGERNDVCPPSTNGCDGCSASGDMTLEVLVAQVAVLVVGLLLLLRRKLRLRH